MLTDVAKSQANNQALSLFTVISLSSGVPVAEHLAIPFIELDSILMSALVHILPKDSFFYSVGYASQTIQHLFLFLVFSFLFS
jgi:hypothetical protein